MATKLARPCGSDSSAVLGVAWGAYTTSDERGMADKCKGWYSAEQAAKKAAKGIGWYGGEGRVLKKPTLTVGGCTYLMEQAATIVVDDTDERTEELRKAALSKLTKAERAALGHA